MEADVTVTNRYSQCEDSYQDYSYIISEINGVRVTLTKRQACYTSVGCKSLRDLDDNFFGTRNLGPFGQVSRSTYWFTEYSSDTFSFISPIACLPSLNVS